MTELETRLSDALLQQSEQLEAHFKEQEQVLSALQSQVESLHKQVQHLTQKLGNSSTQRRT